VSTDTNQKLVQKFGTVQKAILTLFQCTTGGADWNETYDLMETVGPIHAACFVFYILFACFAAFNIVTSIFVDKAMKLAQPDLETLLFEKRREDLKNAHSLRRLCCEADLNASGTISFTEFIGIIEDPKLRSEIEMRGLDIKDAEMFFTLLTSVTGEKEVKIDTFVAGCMKMKGIAMNVDLLLIGFELQLMMKGMHSFHRECMERLDVLSARTGQGH